MEGNVPIYEITVNECGDLVDPSKGVIICNVFVDSTECFIEKAEVHQPDFDLWLDFSSHLTNLDTVREKIRSHALDIYKERSFKEDRLEDM